MSDIQRALDQETRAEAAEAGLTRLREENARLREALTGLMEIAETAMPDSYFASDSRVSIARRALGMKLGDPS